MYRFHAQCAESRATGLSKVLITDVALTRAPLHYSATARSILRRAAAAGWVLTLLVGGELAAPCSAQCVQLPPDLVTWWTGDGNAGDTVGASGGTLIGGPQFTAGKVGTAFTFDGVDDYVSIPHSQALQPANITIEGWIKTPGSANMQLVVEKSHGFIDNTGWALHLLPDGKVSWAYGNGAGFPSCTGTTAVDDDQWHHVAATLDGSTMKVYVDGNLDGSSAYSGAPTGNTRRVHIGASYGGDVTYQSASFVRFFNGSIDELSIYSRALSALEIQTVHAADVNGKCRTAIDTFDGNALDVQRWEKSTPLGNNTITQSDSVSLVHNGTNGTFCFEPSTYAPGVGIALRQRLVGDFDIQVAFHDFAAPNIDHTQAVLHIQQDAANQLHVKRIRGVTLDGIQTVAVVGGVFPIQSGVPTELATQGVFRIRRTGSHVDTFFDDQPSFSLTAFSGPVVVSMLMVGYPVSAVAFDNFYMRSGTLIAADLDTDGDGIQDCSDNCVALANPNQEDCDLDGEGDVCELANGHAKDNNNTGIPDNCEFGLVLDYCTAGTSTHHCLPAMSAVGTPSVSATSGFTVSCTGVEGLKFGIVFYSVTGKQALQWHSGNSSFLCVRPPTQRTPSANSGGTLEHCDGVFSLDFLSYLGTTNALGEPFSAGDMIWFQTWYRDPPASGTTNLSNGLQVTLSP